MCELLCTLKSLKNQIRSWKNPGILFLHESMSPEILTLLNGMTILNRDVTTDQHHHLLVSHFMKHHDDFCNQCNDNLPGILNEFFSGKEIHDCIQKLANKKAAGIEGLINEIFKCSN